MASTDSTSITQVFDALVTLEDSFQRLDSNATRALVIRDAREMIAALSDEQDRLLGTIAALNIETTDLKQRLARVVPLDEHFEVVDPLRSGALDAYNALRWAQRNLVNGDRSMTVAAALDAIENLPPAVLGQAIHETIHEAAG